MEKALFSRIVKEVLLRDGQAELPGLGKLHFVLYPASFSDRGFTLNPPFRKLALSPDDNPLTDRSSEIAALYASANGIPLQRAVLVIGEFISRIKSDVTPSQDFELPGLGKFRRMPDTSIFFVQGSDVRLCLSFDNLPSVSLKSLTADPAEQETSYVRPATIAMPSAAPSPVRHGRKRKAAAWTLGAIAAVMVLFMVFLAVAGRVNPRCVDPLLYTEEQLETLYS